MFFPRWMNRILITWFGLGRVPVAPGTAGSIGALPLCWALAVHSDLPFRIVVALGVTAIAILGAAQDQNDAKTRDPGYVVIDEVAGMLWSTLLLDTGIKSLWLALGIAFTLFRVLDVVKPLPANIFDRSSKTSGLPFRRGLFIVLDDVVAGIYSALILKGIVVYFGL